MEKSCKNCKYFFKYSNKCTGECRYNTPSIMPSTSKITAYPVDENDTIHQPIGVFPMISDLDWCGKFEAKEEAEQE